MSYQVYLASLDGVPRYVGCGKPNRHLHVNSGTSHVRKLNEVVLRDDREFDISIVKSGMTKAEAEKFEHSEIIRIGRDDLGTGTLWNGTSGWGFLHGEHTPETKRKISNASKAKWANLSGSEREEYIQKLKDAPNSGRWVKGQKAPNAGKTGIYGKNWKLLNKLTGESYEFFSKINFVAEHPEFNFISHMQASHDYKWGQRTNWYLTEEAKS